MSKTKSIVTILLVATMLASMTACSGENATENASTPTTTTTVPEVTTEEPTTEYVYKGIEFYCSDKDAEYFNGLILENGDKIYVNDIWKEESEYYDGERGSIAYAILGNFKMEEERQAFRDKYWSDSTWPFVPYSDNYCIEYTGEKVEFVLAEKLDGGVIFDVIPVE